MEILCKSLHELYMTHELLQSKNLYITIIVLQHIGRNNINIITVTSIVIDQSFLDSSVSLRMSSIMRPCLPINVTPRWCETFISICSVTLGVYNQEKYNNLSKETKIIKFSFLYTFVNCVDISFEINFYI